MRRFGRSPDPGPWAITAATYATCSSTADRLGFLLGYAVLAPSSHNTQPWVFQIRDDAVYLRSDRRRSLPVVDPEGRELVISCGAALFNLRLALRHFGHGEETVALPDPGDPDLLAIVRPVGRSQPDPARQAMFEALTRRRTNRQRYEDRDLPSELLTRLQATAEQNGAWLRFVNEGEQRRALIDLIERGDRIQMADRRFRRELAAWMRPNRTSSADGIPGFALGMSGGLSYLGPIFVRCFDLGKTQATKDRQLAEGSPMLAVLGCEDDQPANWLATGQALSAALLAARAESIWAAYLNQPVEVAELRAELQDLVGTVGRPQLVLRMGYAPDVRPTPRRPVSQVLL